MPRPPRVHIEGALYYVTSRAIDGGVLFKDAEDYEAFLHLLCGYRAQYGFKLFGFVLLPDHVHLCLELKGPKTISSIMHALNSRYTKYFTKRHNHSGHVFLERFKSTILEKAPSLLRVTGYLHTHPLRSGLVNDLREYPWSSYGSYLAAPACGGSTASQPSAEGSRQVTDRESAAAFDLSTELLEIADALAREAPGKTYAEFVQSIAPAEWEPLHVQLRQRVIGSPEFIALVEERSKIRRIAAPLEPVVPSIERKPHDQADPSPRPQAPRPRRAISLALSTSVAVAAISLCAAALYAKNLSTIRQTLRVLAQERLALFNTAIAGIHRDGVGARLTNFTRPFHLNGTSWEIEVQSVMTLPQTAGAKDTLKFKDGAVTSQELSAKGFGASKYTWKMRDDGTGVWETVQVSKDGAMVQWHGEWDGQVMHGIMSYEAPGKEIVTSSFVGTIAALSVTRQSTSEI